MFYKIVEAHIRSVHTDYLKQLKRVPVPDTNKKSIKFKLIRVEDKLLKGYNKGVEMALDILSKEFKRYEKRLQKEEKDGKKF